MKKIKSSEDASGVSAFRQNPLRALPSLLRNRYALATLVFVIYIVFFDHYSIVNRISLSQTLRDLEAEKAQYVKIIEESEHLQQTIKADEVKFAREHYYLKHADEDVFIIE